MQNVVSNTTITRLGEFGIILQRMPYLGQPRVNSCTHKCSMYIINGQ